MATAEQSSHTLSPPQEDQAYSEKTLRSAVTESGKRNILIVDDEPDITLTYKVGLENSGVFEVDIHNDPLEALSNYKADFYDLLLIDVKMPKMNGFELYEELKKIDDKVKVCFITALEVYYNALIELFPIVKVDSFIRKPINIDDLVRRIKSELMMVT